MKKLFLFLVLIPFVCSAQLDFRLMTRTDKSFNGLRYIEYYPPDTIEGIILDLHGLGEVGKDLNLLTKNELPKLFQQGKVYNYIIICPQLNPVIWPFKPSWSKNILINCFKLLDTYKVTPRIVTGLSLGGRGTYAAVINSFAYNGNKNGYFKYACAVAGNTSVRDSLKFSGTSWAIYHGNKDTTIGISQDRQLRDFLNSKSIPLHYKEYDWGHSVWPMAYSDDEFLKWLNDQK